MAKTRTQLVVIALVLGCLDYLLLVNTTNDTREVLMFFDTTFLITALGILGCTFIRAKQLPNGAVCFMPTHPLVKFGFVRKNGTNLCPTFWLIGTLITLISFFILIILSLLVGIVLETINGYFISNVVLPALLLIGCCGVVSLVLWLATKDFWILKVPIIILTTLLAILYLYLLPMSKIADNYYLELNNSEGWITGTIIYLKWLGIIVGSITVSVAVIYLAFKHCGALSSSWLGKQIALLKEKLCVRFVECDQGN